MGVIAMDPSFVLAQNINSGSPAYPFPLSVTYPYGIKPNHKTAAQFQADMTSMYNTWYAKAVTAGGTGACSSGCLRVHRNTDGYDTVSEGIGYGMLIAAVMADKTLFDGLWKYTDQYVPDTLGNFVMDWKINSSGGIAGQNGATDADEDIAMALLMAHKQWGSSGTYNYLNLFQQMTTAIWNKEINQSTYAVEPGDGWTGTYFSSYMAPAWYRFWPTY